MTLTDADRRWLLALIAAAVEEKRRFIATGLSVAGKLAEHHKGDHPNVST